MAPVGRTVAIANRHPRLRLDHRAVIRVIHTLDHHFRILPGEQEFLIGKRRQAPRSSAVAPGELSVVFLTDDALAQLHADFLADPTPTDVITFEGDPTHGVAGEICVSADAARRQVRTPPDQGDFSAELTLYVVHGWLHLAGYDDLRPARKRVMRRAETRALRLLRDHPGCTPDFQLDASRRSPGGARIALPHPRRSG